MARLIGENPGVNGRGIVTGGSCTPPSDAGVSALALDVGGSGDDNWVEREGSVVESFFLLQGRGMVGVISGVCRFWGGQFESLEG
jgi:hypothetical protein